MAFDLKAALLGVAPTLATMLGGPMVGGAVASLETAFGLPSGSGTNGITSVLQSGGMTPEIVSAVRLADQKHAEILSQQGIDLARLNSDAEAAKNSLEVQDRSNARERNSGKDAVWWLALLILITFAVLMSVVLYGCYLLLSGGMPIKDPSVVAAVSGLIGAVVGYVASNAQTVVNFIFGGSLGSQKKTDALADSVKQAIEIAGKP